MRACATLLDLLCVCVCIYIYGCIGNGATHRYEEGKLQPEDMEGIDGICFTGTGSAWECTSSEAAPLTLSFLVATDHSKPIYGSCMGMQLACAAMFGANVSDSVNGLEVGM